MGIETVAIYSEPDRLGLHVLIADQAHCVGPAEATASYLDIDRILEVCRVSGADAVHPGYGFLSENATFADRITEAGLIWIGPSAAAIATMGSKTRAREAAVSAGLPVVPGDHGDSSSGFSSAAVAAQAAEQLGFPVMIKASGGGGGKGMRVIEKVREFPAAFESAQREALSAFGNSAVYLEKALIRPRHVEIQVFGDSHGNAVHLGERDCSIQRRHQKIVEESPSPAVDNHLRQQMGAAAVALAKAQQYVGAGTVEFLLDEDGKYYFLEMNTRLQVEHPITEMTYAVDLVAWQLEVARGGRLPMTQDELTRRRTGAAMECRIYAEDPVQFLPSSGTIEYLRTPAGPFVRDDAGIYQGAVVSIYYDPLLSKLVVWGDSRSQVIARMSAALDEYLVHGVETNLAFHRWLLRDPDFVVGDYDIGFVARRRTGQPDKNTSLARDTVAQDTAVVAAVLDHALRPTQASELRSSLATSAWRSAFRPKR